MNSTTPVLSLIKVVNKKLINGETLTALDSKDQRNVAMSLEAIEERTAGMLKFVEAYKQINRPIQPHLESVESTALFESVTSLMNSEHDVNLKVKDEFNGQLMVDRHLFSQVLINLIKNAREATGTIDKPELEMTIRSEAQRVHINIADNGPGVAETAISEIFIPFYTTKKEGSGIGLALSRKIVRAHGGFLSYNRVDDKTQFTINLPRTI
jgi:C4-dicarboxylate-specific signal transduction histidine kinase